VVAALCCCFAVNWFILRARAQSEKPAQDAATTEELGKGQEALKNRNYDAAISAFKKASKRKPDCADCFFMLAVAYSRTGDAPHALEAADKSIALAGDDNSRAIVHDLKGEVFLALGATDVPKLKNAEEEFRQASQLSTSNARYRFNLGKTLALQSKKEEASQEFDRCLALKPDTQMAREARMISGNPRLAGVEFAPDFHLTTFEGQELSLAHVSGKVLVMDFWATWCPPCRESVGELKQLTKKYSTDKLILVSVSADSDDQAWRDFVARKKMDWMQYRDRDDKILHAFNIHAFPTYLVITGDGVIKRRIVGMNPHETIVRRLKETLEAMPELEGELRK
jgi:thioredoxin-like negative regulator of GroEL